MKKVTKQKLWFITGSSESGDYYGPKAYNEKPTEKQMRDFIKNETYEDLEIGGPGNFGSYVYLKVTEGEL